MIPPSAGLSRLLLAQEHRTLRAVITYAAADWELYPVYPVDDEGTCTCPKLGACTDPGKHPMTPNGFKDASSDPGRIAELFSRRPGANVGVRTGKGSGVVVLDIDLRNGGMETLERLQADYGTLPPTRLHATGGGGFHYPLAYPEGKEWVPSKTLGPGVELKADGAGVVLPPSNHTSGVYRVLSHAPLAPAPAWVLELPSMPTLEVIEGEGQGEATRPTESRFELPERIHESLPSRNRTLYEYGCSLRAHGWDHGAILAELRQANEKRCVPPMSEDEVRKIAGSAATHPPGNASTVAPEVLETLAFLKEKAQCRFKNGIAAHSRWAVYRALLDCAERHGRLHRSRDVAVRISVRQLAEDSGVSVPTVRSALKALDEAQLVYRASSGERATPGVLVLRVPRRAHPLYIRTTLPAPPTVQAVYPSRPLYRVRHGYSIGKSAAAVLEAVVECPGASREEIAAMLGRKPESLKRALKKLRELGLVENRIRGKYWPVDGWEEILDTERTMSGEKLAEKLTRQRHEREREAYRQWLVEKENGDHVLRPLKERSASRRSWPLTLGSEPWSLPSAFSTTPKSRSTKHARSKTYSP